MPLYLDLTCWSYIADMLSASADQPENHMVLTEFFERAVTNLAPVVEHVIVDTKVGLRAASAFPNQLWVALHQLTVAAQPRLLPQLDSQLGIAQLSNFFAHPYLELWYHPQEDQALSKKQLVAELATFSQQLDRTFLLTIRMFNPQGGVLESSDHLEAQYQAIQELRRNNLTLAVEYPGSSLDVVTVAAEFDQPWLLASHHQPAFEPYARYKDHLREALDAGVAGAVAGGVIFEGLGELRDEMLALQWEDIDSFLTGTVRDRLIELERIIEESKSSE